MVNFSLDPAAAPAIPSIVAILLSLSHKSSNLQKITKRRYQLKKYKEAVQEQAVIIHTVSTSQCH